MPELPEVEHVVARLRKAMPVGSRVLNIFQEFEYLSTDDVASLCGLELQRPVARVGKIIVMDFGESRYLTCHLAMSGYWDADDMSWSFDYVEGKRQAGNDDVRLVFCIAPTTGFSIEMPSPVGAMRVLRFHDQRKFGKLYLGLPKTRLGPEIILTPCQSRRQGIVNGEGFRRALSSRPLWEIKRALMDQTLVSGLGNIYAAEALYVAGVHPQTQVRDVTDWDRLFACCQDQLAAAIWRDLDYSPLSVYKRKTCKRDGTPIQSVDVAGRTSWFCPTCQPR